MTRHNAHLNHQRNLEHQHAVDHAIRTSAGTTDHEPAATYQDPADARQLRGIPAIGGRGSMGGAIIGSRPDALGWVDERSKRTRTRNP